MLKFSLTLPIILSSLYTSFSRAQYGLPSCAVSCAQAAAYQAGCNPNDPTCVCANDGFIGAVYSCVWQSCSNSDAQTAVNYWNTACGGYGPSSGTGSTPTVTFSSYGPPSSPPGSQSSSSGIETSSTGYGYPTVTSSQPTTSTSITSSNPHSYGGSSGSTSSPVSSSNPYPYGGSSSSSTSSPVSSSTPYPYGGSSASGSGSGSSSRPSSSTSSNLAATMPTHAAALIAGGIGAMVAVFV